MLLGWNLGAMRAQRSLQYIQRQSQKRLGRSQPGKSGRREFQAGETEAYRIEGMALQRIKRTSLWPEWRGGADRASR